MSARIVSGKCLAAAVAALLTAVPWLPVDASEQSGPSGMQTFGGLHFGESVTYDAGKDLYVVANRGAKADVAADDGFVTLLNPDGTVHTLKWIGKTAGQSPLNDPLGSNIHEDHLYVADGDSVHRFDLATGEYVDSVQVEGVTAFNDIEVADDGTVYASQTGGEDEASWRLYRITPQGKSELLVQGAPLNRPNGVAFDPEGNPVVVNMGSKDVLTFSSEGDVLNTEQSADAGNDGLVILPDGTKYVSSVTEGTVARIRPGQKAERIASGIPSAASMTLDPKRNRLLIPMNEWNAITLVPLE